MKWQIPAKTFLLGEYAALRGEAALILTTSPCFTLALEKGKGPSDLHPDSPAGRWQQQGKPADYHLIWSDPYQGRGGLGASSAQFIGTYYARAAMEACPADSAKILEAYYQSAWSGKGIKPSGYDVLAQLQTANAGVFIHKNQQILEAITWPFKDIAIILLHTGKKLATHLHLADSQLPKDTQRLSALAEQGFAAFQENSSALLIDAINAGYQELGRLNLVAPHSREYITRLKKYPAILAMKGCGALGADVILLAIAIDDLEDTVEKLRKEDYCLLATCQNKDKL